MAKYIIKDGKRVLVWPLPVKKSSVAGKAKKPAAKGNGDQAEAK